MAQFVDPDLASHVEPDEHDEGDCLFRRPDPDAEQKCPAAALEQLRRVFDEEPVGRDEDGFVRGYRQYVSEVWLQRGAECTGFALAAIANYHIRKAAPPGADPPPSVSARMLYEMAQDNDGEEWKEASTLRGALKGWKAVGVVDEDEWPYHPDDEDGRRHGRLTVRRLLKAIARPGGHYFRIPPRDVTAMKGALDRGFPLYVGLVPHTAWYRLYLGDPDHTIHHQPSDQQRPGHACVIAGYDDDTGSFWVHNSWGVQWGDGGYGRLPYDDWREHGRDVWVVVPQEFPEKEFELAPRPVQDAEETYLDMWKHLVLIGDDGRLVSEGMYGMDRKSVQTMLYLFKQQAERWQGIKHVAIIADGGYWSHDATLELAGQLKDDLLRNQIYPIFLLWETAWYAEFQAWLYRKGLYDKPAVPTDVPAIDAYWEERTKKEVMSSFAPRAWRELARRASRACAADVREQDAGGTVDEWPQPGAARIVAETIAHSFSLIDPEEADDYQIHLIGHGAGDMLLSRFAQLLAGALDQVAVPISSATLWAPATTVDWFEATWAPLLDSRQLQRMTVFVLDDHFEKADRVGPVTKSLLHLVADVLAWKWDRTSRAAAIDDSGNWAAPRNPVLGLREYLFQESLQRPNLDRRVAPVDPAARTRRYHSEMALNRELYEATISGITGREAVMPDAAPAAGVPAVPGPGDAPPQVRTVSLDEMPLAAAARREDLLSTSELRDAWEDYACATRGMVRLDLASGASITVHHRAADAYAAVHRIMDAHGYAPRREDTGAYNCRRITGGMYYSVHAYGIAADYNWTTNPFDAGVTDMPDEMVAEILGIRTVDDLPVFRWGGHHARPDPMHFEIGRTPDQLDAGLQPAAVRPAGDDEPPEPEIREERSE